MPGDLTDDKEGNPRLRLGEQVQQPVCRGVEPLAVMGLHAGVGVKSRRRLDAVVFFDVEAQNDLGGAFLGWAG